MTEATPRVSVIMPVRNGEQWLQGAIESVLTQTFSDFELLVIDDGSTDRTRSLLDGHAQTDRRIHVLQTVDHGLVQALNLGLSQARGDFIARLDVDDIALPCRLKMQVGYFEAHPATVLLGSWAETFDHNGRVTGRLQPESRDQDFTALLRRMNPFIHSSVMFRTDVARRLGGYRAAFEAAEDYDLWLRMSEVGDIAILPEVLVRYRTHEQSVTAVKAVRQLFSTRIARRAAEMRRNRNIDPANTLKGPPDWSTAAAGSFYEDDARVCRFLALAEPGTTDTVAITQGDLSLFQREIPRLSYRERKIAQIAIMNLRSRKNHTFGVNTRLLLLLFRLHPIRAGALLWRAMSSPS